MVHLLEVWKVSAKIERGCVIHGYAATPSGNVELLGLVDSSLVAKYCERIGVN